MQVEPGKPMVGDIITHSHSHTNLFAFANEDRIWLNAYFKVFNQSFRMIFNWLSFLIVHPLEPLVSHSYVQHD